MKDWNSKEDVMKVVKEDFDHFEHIMFIGITKSAQLTVISGDDKKPESWVERNIRTALFCTAFEKIKIKMLRDDSTGTHSVH